MYDCPYCEDGGAVNIVSGIDFIECGKNVIFFSVQCKVCLNLGSVSFIQKIYKKKVEGNVTINYYLQFFNP